MICKKCGSEVERDRRRRGKVPKEHDCAGARQRKVASVNANVELMKRRNWGAINRLTGTIGQRGGHPPPGGSQSGGGPESMVL